MPRPSLKRLLLALPFLLWMALALGLRVPTPWGWLLSGITFGAALILLWRRPGWPGLLPPLMAFLLVFLAFMGLRPAQRRDWRPDVSQLPTASLEGHQLLIHHVRNCSYRSETDYDPRFEDRRYDLGRLRALDLFLVSWGPRHIAHTMFSFDFGGGEHLAFSIETRKERHEDYSALRGFFREYELCVVAGDERDLVGLRTKHRGEEVRLYRLNTPPERAREILLAYVDRINTLAARPEWYHALTDNCTTAMIGPIREKSGRLPWSWKLLASGHLDEFLYEQGFLSRELPFETLRSRALINAAAQRADQAEDFSARIREGLPPR